jgi:PadR family transcriptional regulator, regulatory protein PadR
MICLTLPISNALLPKTVCLPPARVNLTFLENRCKCRLRAFVAVEPLNSTPSAVLAILREHRRSPDVVLIRRYSNASRQRGSRRRSGTDDETLARPDVRFPTIRPNGSELRSPACGSLPATATRISFPIDILYVGRYVSYRVVIGDDLVKQEQTALLQGTMDLLILKPLLAGEMHGLGVSRRIQQLTGGTFVVKPGSLFPALHRMEEEGWISAFWGDSENNRRAKYYRLTKAGRKQLEIETKRWGRVSWAIGQALEAS